MARGGRRRSSKQSETAEVAAGASTPALLFHAAPSGMRASIREHGLDPMRFPRERWSDKDLGVWCFDTLERAREYAAGRARNHLGERYDVWQLQTDGLAMSRPWFDADLNSGIDVWWLEQSVTADRVELVACEVPPLTD